MSSPSLSFQIEHVENPSVKHWSEGCSLSNVLSTPTLLRLLPWGGTKKHSVPLVSAVLAWFKITSSSITFNNTNLVGIPLIPIEICLNRLGIVSALRTMLALLWSAACLLELKECSNSRSVHSSDDYGCFEPILTKMSLKDVFGQTFHTFSLCHQKYLRIHISHVLRIRQMRLQLQKAKDGVLFLK